MPRIIDTDAADALGLGDAVAALEAARFDPRDEDAFAAQAPILKRLANDRTFLADLAIAELRDRCEGQLRGNGYGAQVIMVHRPQAPWFIRAAFWPAATDAVVGASGTAAFFYGVPHDHNFNFLTVGYLGPGYWSDYWEVDGDAVDGWTGEPVSLVPCGRHRLEEGRVMLYRAGRDVHSQLPADSLSVSLNIMESTPRTSWRDQYRFDVARGEVAGILSSSPLEPLLALAGQLGGESGREALARCIDRHPSDRSRARALHALAGCAADERGWCATMETGLASPSLLVRKAAERALEG